MVKSLIYVLFQLLKPFPKFSHVTFGRKWPLVITLIPSDTNWKSSFSKFDTLDARVRVRPGSGHVPGTRARVPSPHAIRSRSINAKGLVKRCGCDPSSRVSSEPHNGNGDDCLSIIITVMDQPLCYDDWISYSYHIIMIEV